MKPPSNSPRVSVVMAVHNRADYLPEALASIRWQTLSDWECVCVDDGSTDDTPQVLARFAAADPRIRVLRQEKAGITAALTRGDAAAKSNLIARMDSDDVALPERLELQLQYLHAHPDCVGVGGQAMLIDPSGAPIGPASYSTDHEEIERRLLAGHGSTIAHPTLCFRKQAAEAVGGHRSEFEWAHDTDLMVRLAHYGRLANLPETVLLYRQHPGNSCRTHHAEVRAQVLGLLKDAHAQRGQSLPQELEAAFTGDTKQTPLTGKWARRAARNGYLSTAWNLYSELANQAPLSWYTTRVGVELVLRSLIAMGTRHRGVPISVPDWQAFDAPQRARAA